MVGGKRGKVKRKVSNESCSEVGSNAARSGEPLWPDKPGSVGGGIESEDKVDDIASMEIVVGSGSHGQECQAFMAGLIRNELVQTYMWREKVCSGEKVTAKTGCVKPLRRCRTGKMTGRK